MRKKGGTVGAMPTSPLEMTHVGQVQNFRVGSSNHILNSMGPGGPEGWGGGVGAGVSGLTSKHPR